MFHILPTKKIEVEEVFSEDLSMISSQLSPVNPPIGSRETCEGKIHPLSRQRTKKGLSIKLIISARPTR
jgi:hypothetical protein